MSTVNRKVNERNLRWPRREKRVSRNRNKGNSLQQQGYNSLQVDSNRIKRIHKVGASVTTAANPGISSGLVGRRRQIRRRHGVGAKQGLGRVRD